MAVLSNIDIILERALTTTLTSSLTSTPTSTPTTLKYKIEITKDESVSLFQIQTVIRSLY